jgi:hypothetical protein
MSASWISSDRGRGAENGLDGAAEDVVEVREARRVAVHDDGAGAHAHGDLGGVGADGAAADDDDLGLGHAGHAAEEHAAAAVVLLQVDGAGLDGQLAGDLAHREEQRVGAARQLHRLEGDAADVGGDHGVGQLTRVRGGEVQIGVEDLPRLELAVLGGQGLLDLVDHVGAGPDVVDGRHLGAGGGVRRVVETGTDTGALLDHDRVPGAHELLHAVRRHRDAVLLVLDLPGDTDDHLSSSFHFSGDGCVRMLVSVRTCAFRVECSSHVPI